MGSPHSSSSGSSWTAVFELFVAGPWMTITRTSFPSPFEGVVLGAVAVDVGLEDALLFPGDPGLAGSGDLQDAHGPPARPAVLELQAARTSGPARMTQTTSLFTIGSPPVTARSAGGLSGIPARLPGFRERFSGASERLGGPLGTAASLVGLLPRRLRPAAGILGGLLGLLGLSAQEVLLGRGALYPLLGARHPLPELLRLALSPRPLRGLPLSPRPLRGLPLLLLGPPAPLLGRLLGLGDFGGGFFSGSAGAFSGSARSAGLLRLSMFTTRAGSRDR